MKMILDIQKFEKGDNDIDTGFVSTLKPLSAGPEEGDDSNAPPASPLAGASRNPLGQRRSVAKYTILLISIGDWRQHSDYFSWISFNKPLS